MKSAWQKSRSPFKLLLFCWFYWNRLIFGIFQAEVKQIFHFRKDDGENWKGKVATWRYFSRTFMLEFDLVAVRSFWAYLRRWTLFDCSCFKKQSQQVFKKGKTLDSKWHVVDKSLQIPKNRIQWACLSKRVDRGFLAYCWRFGKHDWRYTIPGDT